MSTQFISIWVKGFNRNKRKRKGGYLDLRKPQQASRKVGHGKTNRRGGFSKRVAASFHGLLAASLSSSSLWSTRQGLGEKTNKSTLLNLQLSLVCLQISSVDFIPQTPQFSLKKQKQKQNQRGQRRWSPRGQKHRVPGEGSRKKTHTELRWTDRRSLQASDRHFHSTCQE